MTRPGRHSREQQQQKLEKTKTLNKRDKKEKANSQGKISASYGAQKGDLERAM